jgi:hypothetical protein
VGQGVQQSGLRPSVHKRRRSVRGFPLIFLPCQGISSGTGLTAVLLMMSCWADPLRMCLQGPQWGDCLGGWWWWCVCGGGGGVSKL